MDLLDGGGGIGVNRRMLIVGASSEKGMVRVGEGANATDLFLLDGKTQRAVGGARVEAIEEDDGFLVRVSRDEDAYEPDVVFVPKGGRRTVPMQPATPDVRGRVMQTSAAVFDDGYLGNADLDGVAKFAMQEQRPNVMFVPAIEPTSDGTALSFHVYKLTMPGTLLAVRPEGGGKPADGQVVRGRGRQVGTTGLRRAGVAVGGTQVVSAARARAGEERLAPAINTVAVSTPDSNGAGVLTWDATDSAARLIGFDVGIDTTNPDKRVSAQDRSLLFAVKRGAHFGCVRPVFDGSDADPQVNCTNFEAALAPVAANLRVTVRRPPAAAPAVARKPVPVEVEIENDGDADAEGVEVAVMVSRDGLSEGGQGETRILKIDSVPKRSKTTRAAIVTPAHDGALYVVAEANPTRKLAEGNIEDNLGRQALPVSPVGNNRAPVLSLSSGEASGVVAAGQPVVLAATATDPEEGDLSARIVWESSLDGVLGMGPNIAPTTLSPGVHHITATISDAGLTAAPLIYREHPGKDQLHHAWDVRAPYLAAETPEMVAAEFEIEIVVPSAPVNSAPQASAGPDLTTSVGTPVFPLASASDADGEALTVSWLATDASGVAVPIEGGNSLQPRFVATAPGAHTLLLSVSDGKVSTRDEVIVNVLAAGANRAPILMVQLPPNVQTGTPAVAIVNATDPDGDGVTLSFQLEKPAGSAALLTGGGTLNPAFVPDVPGAYALNVEADDGRGGRMTQRAFTQANTGPMNNADGGVILPGQMPPAKQNRAAGTACGNPNDCASGFCVDGMCCASACVGLCESCNGQTPGQCGAIAPGTDPRDECPGSGTCTGEPLCSTGTGIRPGSVMLAGGGAWLAGQGTDWGGVDDDRRPSACDGMTGQCAFFSMGSNMMVVDARAAAPTPMMLRPNVRSSGEDTGFHNGVLLFYDGAGDAFAWRFGFGANPHRLGGNVGHCLVSRLGNFAACLANGRPSGAGQLFDLVAGPISVAGAPLPFLRTIYVPLQIKRDPMAFSHDEKSLALLSRANEADTIALEILPVIGGGAQLVLREAGLDGKIGFSFDDQWIAFTRSTVAAGGGQDVIGVLALANARGQATVRNVSPDVMGWGWLGGGGASGALGFFNVSMATMTGSLSLLRDPAGAQPELVLDRALPDGIGFSRDLTRMGAIRETNSNGIPELWVSDLVGGVSFMAAELPNLQIRDGNQAFSTMRDRMVFGTGTVQDAPFDRMFVAQLFPPYGSLLYEAGRTVGQIESTNDNRVVFLSELTQPQGGRGVLRIFEGMSPSRVLTIGVNDGFAQIDNQIIYSVSGQGASDGLYRMPIVPSGMMMTETNCNPLQPSCAAGFGCFLRPPADKTFCEPAGNSTRRMPCAGDNQCVPGTQCVDQTCKMICEIGQTACPGDEPTCFLLPGNARYGVCSLTPPGMTMMGGGSCDPVRIIGCSAIEGCYVNSGDGSRMCLISGAGQEGAACGNHSNCDKGLGCYPHGPPGMEQPTCLRFCDLGGAPCGGAWPFCNRISPAGPYGACMATPPGMPLVDGGAPPPDGGVEPPDAAVETDAGTGAPDGGAMMPSDAL